MIKWLLGFLGLILFAVGVPILAVLWIILLDAYARGHAKATDCIQLAGITLTYLAAAAATSFAGRTARQQQERASELEALKADFATRLETLRAGFAEHLEKLRYRLAQLALKEHEAYHEMWSGVMRYYRALSELEIGKYDQVALQKAADLCEGAESNALLVDQKHLDEFHDYWNSANRIQEEAYQKQSDPEALRTLWKKEIRPLFELYARIKKDFSDKLRENS